MLIFLKSTLTYYQIFTVKDQCPDILSPCTSFVKSSHDVRFRNIQSQCYPNVEIDQQYVSIARCICKNLLLSNFNSETGITVTADMPFGKSGMLNISRPAVLRTYYGLNLDICSQHSTWRITYGLTGICPSVGMDPRRFSTKTMSLEMFKLGEELKKKVKKEFEDQYLDTDVLECDYNHCTVLLYNAHMSKVNNTLSFHCDCKYNHKGKFQYDSNTQGENTATIVYSLGDPRTLYFRKRWIHQSSSITTWISEKESLNKFELTNNSIFVLHPSDEKPYVRNIGETLSQFQHGNVRVKEGQLSIGLIFRHVTQAIAYDNKSCLQVLPKIFLESQEEYFTKLDATYLLYTRLRDSIEKSFISNAEVKLSTWNW